MMKKADKILVLFLIFGVVLLIYSTKIVLLLTGRNLEKQEIDTSVLSTGFKYNVDQVSDPEGLMKEVFIRGWIFNPSYQKSAKRYASVIFSGKDFAYELPTEMGTREDVTKHYSEYGLSQNDLGFNCTFSLIALQDGVYEMLIEAWEEGGTPEMISTNRFFQVDKGAFTEITDEIRQNLGSD
jgi:hypothetical protein